MSTLGRDESSGQPSDSVQSVRTVQSHESGSIFPINFEILENKFPLFFHFFYLRFLDDYSTDLGVRRGVGKVYCCIFTFCKNFQVSILLRMPTNFTKIITEMLSDNSLSLNITLG